MAKLQSRSNNGYQITHEVIQKAIAKDLNTCIENIMIENISNSEGAGKGEGYTCVLIAINITACNDCNQKSFKYMAKCLPAIEHRASLVREVSHSKLKSVISIDIQKYRVHQSSHVNIVHLG